ncbi:Transcription factor iws1 [Allomyces arbusculus]|nr:Transcription factor iws1 [Allomyces arbusculus]
MADPNDFLAAPALPAGARTPALASGLATPARADDIFADEDSELSEVELDEADLAYVAPEPAFPPASSTDAAPPPRLAAPAARRPSSAHDDDEEEVEEEDYVGEDLGDGSARRRRGGPKKKSTKKKATAVRGGALPSHLDEEAMGKVLEVRKDFDLALQSMSNARKRRKDVDAQDASDHAIRLRDRMLVAAQRDVDAHDRKETALHKLNMLPEVVRELQRTDLYEVYLDHHILDAIRAWLEPLPDGSLPLYDIRREMFNTLAKLPIDTDNLREVKIGPLVTFYTRAPRETNDIKKIAQSCITKWSRPILNISDSYRDVRLDEHRVDLSQIHSQPVLDASQRHITSLSASQLTPEERAAKRARVPIPNAAGYLVRPSSNVHDVDRHKRKGEARAVEKALYKMRGPGRK